MASTEFKATKTAIPGLLLIDITALEDSRGYFMEKYQREKLTQLGFPQAFMPVQQNVSFNKDAGVLRGIHAEPWDKYVSVISGRVYAAYVDLRKENFGKTVEIEITPTKAVYVPAGVANSFQTLEPNTYYSYLVNAHWSASAKYKAVNPFDPKLGIHWPIGPKLAIISEKDKHNPMLSEVEAF